MNQFDIEEALDKLERKAITNVDKLFNARLKELLKQVSELLIKYGNDPNISVWSEVNRYNRFKKEVERITAGVGDTYSTIIKELEALNEQLYIQKLLMTGYLIEQFVGEEGLFSLPSEAVIAASLINPVNLLTLPNVLKRDRADTINRIVIQLTQGLQAGEGYATIARRLQDAVGISRRKALTTARTEAGRVRSQANVDLEESRIGQETDLDKIWASALDFRVRSAHRILDGKEADKDGNFVYGKNVAKGPLLWIGPDSAALTIQCRCVIIYKVDGMIPEVRRARDYKDPDYQRKLQERVQKYHDEGLPFGQAINKASKEIKPPSKVIPYVTFKDWEQQYI